MWIMQRCVIGRSTIGITAQLLDPDKTFSVPEQPQAAQPRVYPAAAHKRNANPSGHGCRSGPASARHGQHPTPLVCSHSSLQAHHHPLRIHTPTHYWSQPIASENHPPSSQDGSSTLYPLAGCAQHGNRTSTQAPDGRQALTSQIFTFAASCCGAATCSAVCSACGKCGNRSVDITCTPVALF